LSTLFDTAAHAHAWLLRKNGDNLHQDAMRIIKVQEEAGEASSAYIGLMGQNPRKGVTHAKGDVASELCDVILAAATALYDYTNDPEIFFSDHAAMISARISKFE
jgi:hypothetical protein